MASRNMYVDYTFEQVSSRMIPNPIGGIPGIENGIILKPAKLGKIISQTEVELYNGTWNRTSVPKVNNTMTAIPATWKPENVIDLSIFDTIFRGGFNNQKVTFELVFFPNSFIERLLQYHNKEGIRFRKAYCFWNGMKYQNLISEVYPYGFVTASISSPIVQGENIADYNYGFACPPDWNN